MLIEHRGKIPQIHPSAYVAPNAVVCGAVQVGANARILFGAVLTAEDGEIQVGDRTVVMENVLVRGGIVHVNTVLPPGEIVPIGWVAVGDPASIPHHGDHLA